MSILLLYLRIFIGPKFRRICWVVIAAIVCYSIGSSVATVFQCKKLPTPEEPNKLKMRQARQCAKPGTTKYPDPAST